MIEIRLLAEDDRHVLDDVAAGVFDGPVVAALRDEVLQDPRHHLVVALESGGRVVGMASGVHYLHPDKLPEMFVNEVGVAVAYRRQGIARLLLDALLARARELGCATAWVIAAEDAAAAAALYRSAGAIAQGERRVQFEFPLSRTERD